MRALLSIIKKEWLAMSRDVHGLLVLFLMPAAFILVMSLALRDTFRGGAAIEMSWASWDCDQSEESAAFLKKLSEQTKRAGAVFEPPAPALSANAAFAAAERSLARRDIQFAVVVTKGFSHALGESGPGVFVTVLADPALPPALVEAFRAKTIRAMSLERLRVMLGNLWPQDDSGPMGDDKLAGLQMLEVRFARPAGSAELTAVQQSVPAWLVFAMFFVVIPLSTIFIAEKQHGTLPRLRSLRVSPALMLAGKMIPFYLVNLVQTALMLLVGRFVVPLCGGDALLLDVDFFALWLIASAVSVASIGFALAIASIARTTEQATTAGGVANILLAALGGVMVPKLVMPLAMQKLAVFSPMAWGLEGFLDVFARGAGAAGVIAPAAMLCAFAAIGVSVAWWRLRKAG